MLINDDLSTNYPQRMLLDPQKQLTITASTVRLSQVFKAIVQGKNTYTHGAHRHETATEVNNKLIHLSTLSNTNTKKYIYN